MPDFLHLHCHTQYSLLDGASDIGLMMDKALKDGHKGVALTDHGNMFGAFKFVSEANKRGIKPIVGCEFYLVEDRRIQSFSRGGGEQDVRYHQLLLAKNQVGYENLSRLCSLGYIEGLYGKYPRIDKELVEKYHEGLIATSCCLGAEIPQAILKGKLEEAELKLKWWLDLFGEDFYIELQRHKGLANIDQTGVSQEDINQQLISFAKKFGIKTIATNDSHYVEEDDWKPHDILLCVNTNSLIQEENRFKFPSSDFYFKTKEEMGRLFSDVPEALDNTLEIYDKTEMLSLERDVLLPAFPIPTQFKTQEEYLRHLTYIGAAKKYPSLNDIAKERIEFELNVIEKSGYAGYFLIVQDFTNTARKMGVAVGPGRGSAAGSAVAYCLGITNIDPIKYDLLFERFLNPERISMPDIDIDFDDEGRQKVLDYVIDKYGRNQVAQIVTYGTMAAKMSIRDVGRVMNIPLSDVDKVSKAFPNSLKANLQNVLAENDIEPSLKSSLNQEELEKTYQFRKMASEKNDIGQMIQTAKKLEGSVRNTGIHACGVVITPDEISKFVPVKTDKGSDILITQFDNSVAEAAGLLKMDFLGLKTLSIIKDAVLLVEKVYGIKLDIEEIPLDDQVTYELFQRGDTIGIFQYESAGMQKYLKELMPTTFEDLIAMNALYRPGPLEYIPNFIARKHGKEVIVYDLPVMEEYLHDTYGITVYQEQVMLLSQKIAGFTKGQADMLRKAMGKKKKDLIDQMYPLFLDGGIRNGHPKDKLEKIWKDWEAFASYAFNKSHSTCYAFIAFQTAFLKANYPEAFMASVLTHNKNDISKVTFFLQESKRMGLDVLGPDINESLSDFSVNSNKQIRFGLSALKGVGEGPVSEILENRQAEGYFKNIFDLVRRLSLRSLNKKVLESLVLGGAFDGVKEIPRSAYFAPSEKYDSLIEHALKYGQAYQLQKSESSISLFGNTEEIMIPEPGYPPSNPWSLIDQLNKEKEVTGIFISGHPLDLYRSEIKHFTTCGIENLNQHTQKQIIHLAGLVSMVNHRSAKNGNGFAIFEIQDYNGSMELRIFGEDYQKFKHLLEEGMALFIKGRFQKGWKNEELEFKISEIALLETIGLQKTNSITIRIPVQKLNTEIINQLEELANIQKGPHDLKIEIIDQTLRNQIKFKSKKFKVLADNQFISAIEKLKCDYQINN